ncbi:MAG: HIT domain-containing protein [Candidatus Woesearchaeota archaeon]|jgi:histidine triad (HIT) family protein|nr:HIT domain-containing protein [Candidatus Woesearchaeota archaeon]MDP7323176.1 HIT domain-containing protein [Candidatus Woesearchaeota archaeon]MDP7457157.1 HIT domain-containing protein [Candidatus Woesearchaeota archaeon]
MSHLPPEVQKQLDEQKAECPFCKIIKGEIESKKVFEDKDLQAILDINPVIKGHTLLVPKEHYPILPMLPPEVFKHMFTIMPKFLGAVQKAMLSLGVNLVIANGGVAGQRSPHFLMHVFPRDTGDGFNKYELSKNQGLDEKKEQEAVAMLSQNIPQMMGNHFQRNPAKWKTGKIETGKHLEGIKSGAKVIYEDEKFLCVVHQTPQAIGHLAIYSQEEEHDITKLEGDIAFHMFSVASLCATAVYEGLKAEGSNIILLSGKSDDNPQGKLAIHILPRYEKDGFDMVGEPLENKPDVDEVASKIKGEMFELENAGKDEKKIEVIDYDKEKKIVYSDKSEVVKVEKKSYNDPVDEITDAMDDLLGD